MLEEKKAALVSGVKPINIKRIYISYNILNFQNIKLMYRNQDLTKFNKIP